jgi:diguanylate cyclase (GGDEF)-like protein
LAEKSTVLVVDDDPANIHAIANCLKEECVIKVATSGIKCIQLASQDPIPDLILLDVVMPEMDGYRTLEILKSENETKDIPVIFVTANTDLLEEEKGLKAGAVDYITKPIRPFIVLARVNTHLTLKKQKDSLIELARQDPLTGLHNRLALKEAAQREIPRANRHSKSLSMLMIDVDYFKKINDLHGHDVGDQVLKEVSDALKSNFRREDLVVRFGGEEFVVLLPLCDTKQAKIKGEETLRVIEQSKLGNIKVTVSIGCATLKPDETFESLLKRADQSLYKAKERGRNRIELAI